MSTASGPLSTLPWPSATLPITITFPGTVFPTTRTSDPVVTISGTSVISSSTTSFTTTETGGQSSSTGTTSAISTPSETRSTRTISTSSSPSTRLSSASSTLQSASLTRTASSSTVTPSASTTLIRGTLAPSDDSDGGGPTVAAAQQEISRLKETRTIVIAVLSALALVAVLVAARAVYLRRRGYSNTHRPPPTPLPQHKSPAGPLLTADTPMGGTTHGAPWPFLAVPEWHPNRLAPPPPPPRPHMHMQQPQRASILPQTLDAWIAGAGSSSVDLRSVSQPATPSPHVRHEYKQGYI